MRKSAFYIFLISIFIFSACAKKQTVRPEGPYNAEASFAKANALFENKDYDKAQKLFERIKAKDTTGLVAPLAELRIADTYQKKDEPDSAIDEYRKFLQVYPDHKFASYAQYQIAVIYFSQIEGYDRGFGAAKKALQEFETLRDLYPRNPYKDSVSMHISRCRYIMASYEFMVGDFYYKKKAYRGALGRFEGILANYPDFRRTAEVLYLAANSAKALGYKDKAGLYLDQLQRQYPESLFAARARKELAKR
ncbi:MAG: outer membrane protein assembly factor BamD [Nitrospiraceae bacterium]|nr:outer membrane protein assembly factor BamD [Nitrospiraceae bacterium]